MAHTSNLPPLDGLKAVEAAARLGSFSAAGDELGLTHSAVSRRVKSVEAWLGTRLFERQARGVSLTPAGHRFTQTIDQAFSLIRKFAEQWRPGRSRNAVRLSVVPSMARLWFLPRLSGLQGDPPDLRIDLIAEHRTAQLDGKEADIVIRYGRGNWDGFRGWKLFGETLIPVASPELPSVSGAEMSPEEIAQFPLLHDSDTKLWRAWYRGTPVTYRTKSSDRRFEDYDMVLTAAKGKLGVALLRSPLGDAFCKQLGLVPLTRRSVISPNSNSILVRTDESRPYVFRLVDRLISSAS